MFSKTFKVIRNHPKKIIFFGGLTGFGINFAKEKYDEECLMRAYCEEALKYGDLTHRLNDKERHVTVILNPAANSGKSKARYEKYCAPLLHLAGMKVALVRTEHEDQAKQIMDVMDNTSAVVIGGGDGTVSEILTGLLRRNDAKTASQRFPLGILPLGDTNTVASAVWGFNNTPKAVHLAEATMAIVRNLKRNLDVMEITPLEEDKEGKPSKSIYAAAQLDWGAFRDAKERKSDYWYWAFLKKYMVYVFSSYKDLSWNCAAELEYTLPCSGCSKCKGEEEKEKIEALQKAPKRWWQAFVPRSKANRNEEPQIDYSSIINDECGKTQQLAFEKISEVKISTCNTLSTTNLPGYSLSLQIGKEDIGTLDFIKEGWRRESKGVYSFNKEYSVGKFVLKPSEESKLNKKGKERELSIDNEVFEVRPMKIKPVPNAVTIFAPPKLEVNNNL